MVLEAWLAPISVGCQVLPCVETAGHSLVDPVYRVAGCRAPVVLGASAGPLVGGARFWGGWLQSQGPGSSVGLLVGGVTS